MGRFEVTVSLKGTQPEVITQKRILSKTPTAELALIEHYNKYKNGLCLIIPQIISLIL